MLAAFLLIIAVSAVYRWRPESESALHFPVPAGWNARLPAAQTDTVFQTFQTQSGMDLKLVMSRQAWHLGVFVKPLAIDGDPARVDVMQILPVLASTLKIRNCIRTPAAKGYVACLGDHGSAASPVALIVAERLDRYFVMLTDGGAAVAPELTKTLADLAKALQGG